jgi:hypothetical protein
VEASCSQPVIYPISTAGPPAALLAASFGSLYHFRNLRRRLNLWSIPFSNHAGATMLLTSLLMMFVVPVSMFVAR